MNAAQFFSKAHGKTFAIGVVLQSNDAHFLEGLLDEVSCAAASINRDINEAKRNAAVYGKYLTVDEFRSLEEKRAVLAAFQQPLQRRLGKLKRDVRKVKAEDQSLKLATALQALLAADSAQDLQRQQIAAQKVLTEYLADSLNFGNLL